MTTHAAPRRRFSSWTLAKILLGLFLAAVVISRTDLEQLLALRERISWPWLWLTVALFLLLSMLKAWQYHRLLEARVSYPQALSVAVLQNAVSNFIATSAGAATYMTILKAEQGVKLSRSASVFLLLKVGDVFSLGLGLLLSWILLRDRVTSLTIPILILLSVIALGLLAFGLALSNREWFARLFRRLMERTGLARFGLVGKGLAFLDSLAQFDRAELARLVRTAAVLSLLYFALTIAWTYASLHAFSLPVSLWVVVFVTAMLQILSIVPIQVFGGLGVSEAASLVLFGLFGFVESELAAVLIGMRILFTLTNLAALFYLPAYALFFPPSAKTDP